MQESTIFGVSVRAILSLFTVVAGFAFIFAVTFLLTNADIVDVALAAVIGFVNLALGYYLGQKTQAPPA